MVRIKPDVFLESEMRQPLSDVAFILLDEWWKGPILFNGAYRWKRDAEIYSESSVETFANPRNDVIADGILSHLEVNGLHQPVTNATVIRTALLSEAKGLQERRQFFLNRIKRGDD